MRIIVDVREPDWVGLSRYAGMYPSAIEALKAGDLRAELDNGDIILIERKEADDFIASLSDGRLKEQVKKMKDITPWCYVLVNAFGIWPDGNGLVETANHLYGWGYESIQEYYIIVQELGAFFLPFYHYGSAASQIITRPRTEPIELRPARAPKEYSGERRILYAFPKIGAVWSEKIAESFRTLAEGLVHLSEPTPCLKCKHIPPVIRQEYRQTLGLAEDEVLRIYKGA